MLSGSVTPGVMLIDGRVYSMIMSYRWSYNGNTAISSMTRNITFDITPPVVPLLFTPASNSFVGPSVLPINFTIYEQAKVGSVQLTIINVCSIASPLPSSSAHDYSLINQ